MHHPDPKIAELVEKTTRSLCDQGKLIEAGWEAMRILSMPPDAPPVQVTEMRKAFFFGAQHLFASIMAIMDPGKEPTDQDLNRMTLIHQELDTFTKEVTGEAQEGTPQ